MSRRQSLKESSWAVFMVVSGRGRPSGAQKGVTARVVVAAQAWGDCSGVQGAAWLTRVRAATTASSPDRASAARLCSLGRLAVRGKELTDGVAGSKSHVGHEQAARRPGARRRGDRGNDVVGEGHDGGVVCVLGRLDPGQGLAAAGENQAHRPAEAPCRRVQGMGVPGVVAAEGAHEVVLLVLHE